MTFIDFTEKEYVMKSGALRVNIGGSGRALIHLHSAAGPRMSKVLHALADHHTVHAPVIPGFEGTQRHPGVASMQDVADLIAGYISDHCNGECDVIGESFGGWIALWLAIRHPALVGQLVLEAPAGLRPADKGGLPNDTQDRQRALHAKPENVPDEKCSEQILMANRKAVAEYTTGIAFDKEMADRLGEIKSRTLVLMGTLDKVIPPDSGQLLKQHVPQSHLTYIWDAAHALEFDQPKRVATLALDFLDRGESFLVRPAANVA